MKYVTGILAAVVLAMASTGAAAAIKLENWDVADLDDDWRVSQVMEGTVYSKDGKEVGEIHDVILSENGLIDSIVVEQIKNGVDYEYFEVPWVQVDFIPSMESATLELTQKEVDNKAKIDVPEFSSAEEMEASNLIGMQVNLTDEEGYGEIHDLLFTPAADDLSAYVVESGDKGSVKYAVPADWNAVHYDEDIVDLPYSVMELEELDDY